ncbi:MAG: DUF115 domain-containing protein [bacterium]|nr:DUF115 domain-containing protein [bacterium]
MHGVTSLEAFATKTGVLSIRHKARGVLIHSAVDPISEARTIAAQILISDPKRAVIIGCGLGYLEHELSSRGVDVTALEVHPEVFQLRHELRHLLHAGNTEPAMLCEDSKEMRAHLATSRRRALYIAPYVSALADELPRGIASEILAARVMDSSRAVYKPLIEANERRNALFLDRLPIVTVRGRKSNRLAIAVGAGPSAERCIDAICAAREHILIVAASGAVPVLASHGITPDWTIALEARDSLGRDIDHLSDGAKVIAFPWSDREVFLNARLNCYLADESSDLVTGGGTSALTAADFAFKITRGNVYLVGMDLTNMQGTYASGALRSFVNGSADAPKFAMMRSAFVEWSRDHRQHRVFHVISPGVTPLAGLRAVTPALFAADLGDAISSRTKRNRV